MEADEDGLDRVSRIIFGAALLILGILVVKTTRWMIVFMIGGAILFMTGLVGFCLSYLPLMIDTRSDKKGIQESTQ